MTQPGAEADAVAAVAGGHVYAASGMKTVANPAGSGRFATARWAGIEKYWKLLSNQSAAIDSALHVAVPWHAAAPGDAEPARPASPGDDLAGLRAAWADGDVAHWVRLYDMLPGRSAIDPAGLDDAALIAWGETTARLGLAL